MTDDQARLARIRMVAPVTHSALRVADARALAALNRAIDAGGVVDRSGKPVAGPLDGALIADADGLIFPVRDGIPVMLRSDAIPVAPPFATDLGG